MKKKRKLKRKVVRRIKKLAVLMAIVIVIITIFHKSPKEELVSSKRVMNLSFFDKANQTLKVIQNYDEYPSVLQKMLAQNVDMVEYVSGYLDNIGKTFGDDIGDIKKGEVPLLLQYDTRWGYGIYGDDVIAIEGCAPTSLAMVVAYLNNDNTVTPYDIAVYAYENGYYVSGIGSNWTLMSEGSEHFGVHAEEVPLVKSIIFEYLEEGKPMIASMGPGYFTNSGHFIVFTGVENGKIKVNDPNSRERSAMLWDYDEIESQINNLWVFEKK